MIGIYTNQAAVYRCKFANIKIWNLPVISVAWAPWKTVTKPGESLLVKCLGLRRGSDELKGSLHKCEA